MPHEGDDAEAIWTRVKDNFRLLDSLLVRWVRINPMCKPRWMSPAVRRARDDKRRSWADWRRCPTTANWERFARDRNRLKTLIRRAQVAADLRLSNNMGKGNRRFFAHLNHFRMARKSIQNVRRLDGSDTVDLRETAQLFKETFSDVYKADDHRPEPRFPERVLTSQMAALAFTPEATRTALEGVNPHKSAGPDGVHPSLIRTLASVLAAPIAELFNRTLVDGVPAEWKQADVIPLHKKGDTRDVGNYRPVSLTSVVCKVQERLVRQAMYAHMVANGILSDAQHGFVHQRSCLSNLLSFLDGVTSMMEEGEDVDVCFMDFKKAFDLVNHRLLLVKLRALGFGGDCIDWVRSFLEDRMFRVKVEGDMSDWAAAPSGVPQGSVLGPILFVVYINDLPEVLSSPSFLFADDLKIVNSSSKADDLTTDLQAAALWATQWDMEFSWAKCKTLHCGHGLAQVDSFKDLGVLHSPDMKHHEQVDAAVAKARSAAYLIRRAFTFLTPEVFLKAYTALVRPVLEYCIQAWSPTTAGDMTKIENVQRMTTKLVPSLRLFPYEVRLAILGLFPCLKGKVGMDPSKLFTPRPPCNRRGTHSPS